MQHVLIHRHPAAFPNFAKMALLRRPVSGLVTIDLRLPKLKAQWHVVNPKSLTVAGAAQELLARLRREIHLFPSFTCMAG
jgi:hypothetical protein